MVIGVTEDRFAHILAAGPRSRPYGAMLAGEVNRRMETCGCPGEPASEYREKIVEQKGIHTQLYPIIDMKNGQYVQLKQGAFKDITIYSDAPEEVAAHQQEKRASFLHPADSDDALAGYSVNKEVIRRIADTVSILIEIDGGIRSEEAVQCMLGLGVGCAIIGTRAVEHSEFLRDMVRTFGERTTMAGVNARDDVVAVEGQRKVSSPTTRDLCLTMKEYGVRHIVYTDIPRDGMLSSPSVGAIRKLIEETGLDIIASGRVSCVEDLECLHKAGIRRAIIGKALYESRVDLTEAMRLYEAQIPEKMERFK